ncbi:MAG: 3'-5' exonuclease, partial [Syntrophomonas sp.]|nr:3'-5' exonuclease [Syntrophomonas sp.]
IQLALFLALHELAENSVWVGDPKQAIYGFRGTDPQLMYEVVALMKESSVLGSSWRSRKNLINFTNALFSEVFHEMGNEKVCLNIPDERIEQAKDGWLEAWHLQAKNNDEEATAVANGLRNLIERVPGIKPGDIAVFCRTNAKCKAVAGKLEQLGIRVSVGQGSLLDTRECGLALAALRYMNNPGDTVALAEIIHMSPEHNENWLNYLMNDPTEIKKQWQTYPIITILREGHNQMSHWTPMEALEQAISRINLLRTVKSWSNPRLAISNLDALRGNCREYINQCASHRSSATVDGFLAYLRDAVPGQAQGTGDLTVKLLTYHGAKGLEWPWIVLTGLDTELKDDVFGVHIEAALKFDPTDPLANRKIRYWPWPFGDQKKYPMLDQKIDGLELKNIIRDMAEREAQRLMYVGMTRAKDGMVMGIRKTSNKSGESLKTHWLDILKGADGRSVIEWNMDKGSQELRIGNAQIPITVLEYGPDSIELDGLAAETQYLPVLSGVSNDYPAARIMPSALEFLVDIDSVNLDIIENFGARIYIKGQPEMDAVGNAIHAYLAVDYRHLMDEQQLEFAQGLIKQWGVEMAIEASELVAAGQRLAEFLDQRYPGYQAFREWPISLRNDEGQLMQGWIDLLLEIPNGYVIIDHKSYPGQDSEERAKKYIPQLRAYKEAVEKATDKPVVDTLLHLPVSGLVLGILLPSRIQS